LKTEKPDALMSHLSSFTLISLNKQHAVLHDLILIFLIACNCESPSMLKRVQFHKHDKKTHDVILISLFNGRAALLVKLQGCYSHGMLN